MNLVVASSICVSLLALVGVLIGRFGGGKASSRLPVMKMLWFAIIATPALISCYWTLSPHFITAGAVSFHGSSSPLPLALLWALGFFVCIARLAWGVIQLSLLSRRSAVHSALHLAGVRIIVGRNDEPVSACTWGVSLPTIYLPASAEAWDDVRLKSVLAHETAHIKNLDWLQTMIAHLICAVHWFNPFMWVFLNEFRVQMEHRADAVVLSTGVPAVDYAEHLLSLARSGRRTYAVAMHETGGLEQRVRAILQPRYQRRSWIALAAAFTLILCGTAASGLQPPQVRSNGRIIAVRPLDRPVLVLPQDAGGVTSVVVSKPVTMP